MRVDHRRRYISMSQQLLYGPNVLSTLEKMRGKRVPESVACHPLCHAARQRGAPHRALDDSLMNVMPPDRSRAVLVSLAGWKNPLPSPLVRRHRPLPRQRVRQPNPRSPVTNIVIMKTAHALEMPLHRIQNHQRQHRRTMSLIRNRNASSSRSPDPYRSMTIN
jgi:hypothetical protein